jgi:hypothetical protein
MLLECHWSSTNHLGTLKPIEQHTKNFLGVQELAFIMFGDLVFLSFWPPSTLGNCSFFNSIIFFIIFSAFDVPLGGVQV